MQDEYLLLRKENMVILTCVEGIGAIILIVLLVGKDALLLGCAKFWEAYGIS